MFAAADVVTLTLYAAAYTVQSLVTRKLGVRRWLNYNEALWKAALPLDIIAAAASSLLIISCAVIILRLFKYRMRSCAAVYSAAAAAASVIFCCCFAAIYSAETVRAYYLVLPLLYFASLIQIARAAFIMLRR